jgi:hypothetical protein
MQARVAGMTGDREVEVYKAVQSQREKSTEAGERKGARGHSTEAAVTAVRRRPFEPATKNGEPV